MTVSSYVRFVDFTFAIFASVAAMMCKEPFLDVVTFLAPLPFGDFAESDNVVSSSTSSFSSLSLLF